MTTPPLDILQMTPFKDEEFYEGMGVYFIALATNLGYGSMLQVDIKIFLET